MSPHWMQVTIFGAVQDQKTLTADATIVEYSSPIENRSYRHFERNGCCCCRLCTTLARKLSRQRLMGRNKLNRRFELHLRAKMPVACVPNLGRFPRSPIIRRLHVDREDDTPCVQGLGGPHMVDFVTIRF
ncbi:hypothetical protein J2W42_005832 [Rhizobium tibeticum]|nr:hypothetical protein [Rhizobium tibeticum]